MVPNSQSLMAGAGKAPQYVKRLRRMRTYEEGDIDQAQEHSQRSGNFRSQLNSSFPKLLSCDCSRDYSERVLLVSGTNGGSAGPT